MGMEAAPDEVAHLFEAYRREHVTSSLTLPQFRQVRLLRTARGEAFLPPPSLLPARHDAASHGRHARDVE
jgi:hypothetical protein